MGKRCENKRTVGLAIGVALQLQEAIGVDVSLLWQDYGAEIVYVCEYVMPEIDGGVMGSLLLTTADQCIFDLGRAQFDGGDTWNVLYPDEMYNGLWRSDLIDLMAEATFDLMGAR